jgi:uncharacterized RDD family membrane protein YckC
MKSPPNAFRSCLLLAALLPFAAALHAADPAKPQDTAAPAPEAPLHEIGAPPDITPTPTPTPTLSPAPKKSDDWVQHQYDDGDHNRVSVGDSTTVGKDEVLGGNAVAVFGPVKVDGTVNGNAVSVMGSNTINGTVHGNVVVVLGTARIGSHAHVDGNVVAGVGIVLTEPGAYIGGNVVQQTAGINFAGNSEAASVWHHALKLGRPLAFGPHLFALWIFHACLIAFYLLLAAVFPVGVTKCADTLALRPGLTLLTGILSLLGLPLLFILLCVTVIGIPVALIVLPVAFIGFLIFGKTAVYALVGRSILGKVHPALSMILGAAVLMALYLVPFLGGALWLTVAFLGFACALTTLFTSRTPPPAPIAVPVAPAPQVPAGPPAAPMAAPSEGSAVVMPPLAVPGEPAPAPVPPPLALVPEAALPRAGFWIRMVALLIDVVLVGIVTRMHDWYPLILAIYGAVLWKLRGATVGDIIFGLRVVRVDGGSMEWVTVIVRALACFFSAIALGLGFIWIAFDREKQGWHDKIAGTVVVRHPKGTSLV